MPKLDHLAQCDRLWLDKKFAVLHGVGGIREGIEVEFLLARTKGGILVSGILENGIPPSGIPPKGIFSEDLFRAAYLPPSSQPPISLQVPNEVVVDLPKG